jgi:AraC-like DNA-binding protein
VNLRARKPGPPLDAFVESFWTFQSAAPSHAKERALPDGCAALIINLKEDETRIYDRDDFSLRERFNGSVLVGPQKEFCVIDTAEQTDIVGIHFKPGGAYPFFAPPVDELHGRHLPLDLLWGSFARELRERLLEAATPNARLELMEQALLTRLRHNRTSHPAVNFALRQFQARPLIGRIVDVAERTGFSRRHFIDLFSRQVGLTPKLFCRINRFQRVLRCIGANAPVEWADVAVDSGYFDQAHFIHDFRAFSGINPSSYQETRPWHTNHVPVID